MRKPDVVDEMLRAIPAEGMVDWMIQYHKLPESARETVVVNLREQFKWHRLQGRMDQRRFLWLRILARLFKLRQPVKELRSPSTTGETP